jgi:hypothetical protein
MNNEIEDDDGFIQDNDPNFAYKKAARESTLLSIIAQSWSSERPWNDPMVQKCYNELRLLSSRKLARGIYNEDENSKGLRSWAMSL